MHLSDAPSHTPPAPRRRALRAAVLSSCARFGRQPRCKLALLLGLALSASLLTPAPAAGQSPYPPRRDFVADGTGSLGADDTVRLSEDYATRIGERYALEGILIAVEDCRPGPDPYFDGSLVHYGLAPRPGELVDDALAFFVCADLGYAGFSYSVGNAYARYLDPIGVERAMVGPVAEGDVLAAVEAGLDVVVADLQNAPPGRGGYAPAVAAAVTPPPFDGQLEDEDPGAAAGLGLALAALALFGLWAWSRVRDRRTDPAAGGASPEPLTVHKVAERVAALEGRLASDSALLSRLMSLCEPLGDPLLLELDRRHQKQVTRFQELRRKVEARATAPTALATADAGLSEGQRLEALLAEAEALHAYAEQLELEANHAVDLSENAPERVAAASEVLLASHAVYRRATSALDDRPLLALPAADTAMRLPERLWGLADAQVDATPLFAARQAEDAADLARRIARAAGALRGADRRVAAAARAFTDLAGLSSEAWMDVRGDGSEADESLALAAAMMRALLHLPPDQLGSDPGLTAALQLGRAVREIDRARSLASGLLARAAFLSHTQAAARKEHGRLKAELESLVRDGLVGGVGEGAASEPTAAVLEQLALAEDAMDGAVPDPTKVRTLLRQADESMDRLPGRDVRSAQRARLRSLRRDAEAVVQRAGDYQSHHEGDVGRRAAGRLVDALEARRAARKALPAGSGEGLRAWARVARIGREALDIALADVARADARRPAWAPRERWAGPIAPPAPPPRRAPFPGRFGDWGEVRDPGRPPRQGRWGGRPAQEPAEIPDAHDGAATLRLETPGW